MTSNSGADRYPVPPGLGSGPGRAARLASEIGYPFLAVAVILISIELWVRLSEAPSYLVPAPSQAAAVAWNSRVFLIEQAWVTTQEMVLGFLLAASVSLPLAILIGTYRTVEKTLFPLLVLSQAVPKLAFAPLLLIWIGFGISSKIVISALISFFPIVLNSILGLKAMEVEHFQLAKVMGASRTQMFLRIRFPNAAPSIFTGLKLAALLSLTGAIVGEFLGSDAGLGRTLLVAIFNLNTPLLFATVLYIAVIGITFYSIIELGERLSIPWHISRR